MNTAYSVRLYRALIQENFNLSEDLVLSDSMHHAEAAGYECTPTEERLWTRLTARIEAERDKSR